MSEQEEQGGGGPAAGDPGAAGGGAGAGGAAPGGAAGPGGEPGIGQPTEEEVRAALEEQMRRIRVEDVLVQTAVTLVNLAGRRLGLAAPGQEGEGEKDVEQARLAIEATRALVPLLPGDIGPIRDALSQLQVAYAREAGGGAPAGTGAEEAGAGEPGSGPASEQPAQSAEEAERAKARSKLWTPPGA